MLHDILALRDEAKKTLYALEQKLDIKNKSVEVIYKAKERRIKKGQEKRLQHYQKEKALSENKLDTEIKAIQGKILSLEEKAEAEIQMIRNALKIKVDLLENKINQVNDKYNTHTKVYYNQIFEELYESDTNQEEIKINQGHHELLTKVTELKKNIAFWDNLIEKDARREEDKLRAEFEATKKVAPVIKHKPKTAKKASDMITPVKDEFQEFKEARLEILENAWRIQLNDIRSLKAPLPEEGSDFYSQPELFLTPGELNIFKVQGGIRSHLISCRNDAQDEHNRQKELEEKEALRQEELDRAKLLEKAKYGLSC